MFQLVSNIHLEKAEKIIQQFNKISADEIALKFENLINEIRKYIPEKKRISYGRYSIIKKLGLDLYPTFEKYKIDVLPFAIKLYENPDYDQFVRSFAVQLISIYGVETKDLKTVLPLFEKAATDEKWEARECSAGFVRKLVKAFPVEMKKWYLKQVTSDNPLARRFASESIRPVADNKWFKKNPQFCFDVIENLYTESKEYPRTSVGNNLSDWARIDKERVFKIVEELVAAGNKNSYCIAYRACRNLVKTEPLRVMDILKVDEYRYKKRVHYREEDK